jgi:hypothetical protein
MSPETFMEEVRHYCQWAESAAHNLEEVHPILLALMEGAPGLKTVPGFPPERTLPGLPREVSWADTKRFADLPFQGYPAVFWPYEMHPEGPWTDNIHEDFAHILAELQYGLKLLEREGSLQALRYWRDSYFFHWGHHASAAVWAIEWNRNRDQNGEPDASPNGGPAS